MPSRSERPWELREGWRPRVWEPDSGQWSYAVVAPNSGFMLQWLSQPSHLPSPQPAESHSKGGSAGPGCQSQGHPHHDQTPPCQTSRSLARLQEPLVGILVTALNIMMSLLMDHPLGVQAEWTTVHHFPFDPDTYSFTQCSLSGLPRAFLSYKGLNRFAWSLHY